VNEAGYSAFEEKPQSGCFMLAIFIRITNEQSVLARPSYVFNGFGDS
jgi:hypothetical protein